tara:strand:- start:2553 stop:3284 length:732 start_codon:yes stop_codon:yes gene_type:complete
MTAFDQAWALVKAERDMYPFTEQGLPLVPSRYSQKRWDEGQRIGSQGNDKINAEIFRVLSSGLKRDPVMAVQFPMGGKKGTQLYGSEVPLMNTKFNISEQQKQAWLDKRRNVHAKIGGDMKITDINRLMGGEKASDMFDYDVEYRNSYPIVLDNEGEVAPHITYRPFTVKDGKKVINPDGTSGTKEFVMIDPKKNPNFDPYHYSNVSVPRGSSVDSFGVGNPYAGVSYPFSSADEIIEMIRNN